MGLVKTILSALAYPKADSVSLKNQASVRKLVAWLENIKIRHYAPPDRQPLVRSGSWPDIFHKYLKDLECPIAPTRDNQQSLLEWLLTYALHLEYGDNADQYNATAAELSKQQQEAAAGQLPYQDLQTPEVQQQLATLLQVLHVDTSQGSLLEQLQIARDLVRDSIIPSTTDGSVKQAVASGNLQDVPLGFETGDADVDAVATILRLLYIKDLRQLQTAIDQMVVQLQAYTANPRTDASLGKVGH